jgi:hypothetical protein
MRFRLADENDSNWVADSVNSGIVAGLIDPKDAASGLRKNEPTSIGYVVEDENGKPVAFGSFKCVMHLNHLAFPADARAEDRKKALTEMLRGIEAFSREMGIREISTLSAESYPVARWSMQNGFVVDPRQYFRYDINAALAKELEAVGTGSQEIEQKEIGQLTCE